MFKFAIPLLHVSNSAAAEDFYCHSLASETSAVDLRSLAVGFCGCIKGCPDFTKSKGPILRLPRHWTMSSQLRLAAVILLRTL